MSSQMRDFGGPTAFHDEVEIWIDNVIHHTADIPSSNKSKEHPDPLNILGDQELNIPWSYRLRKRKRDMSEKGSPSKGLATRQSPRRKDPSDLAPISLPPSASSARGRSPTKRSPPKLSHTRRSPTKKQDLTSNDSSHHRSAVFQASLPTPSEGVSSSRSKTKKSQSPTHLKKTMSILEECNPPIKLKEVREFKKEVNGKLPSKVHDLAEALYFQASTGFIPRGLKDHYTSLSNTPTKSNRPIASSEYIEESTTQNPLETLEDSRVQTLPEFVDDILGYARLNAATHAHERQWGMSVVTPLLQEVLKWGFKRKLRAMNVESVGINPEFQVERSPGGLKLLDIISNTSASKDTENCMIDMQYGLLVHQDDLTALRTGYRNLPPEFKSINQTLVEYTKEVPAFVDFELKRKGSDVDPKFQLAVWGAGLYLKRKHHGWDVSMPIIGIAIEGHTWECFLLFEHGEGFWHKREGLIMMGPIDFGDTKSILGIYKILSNLKYLAEWGQGTWKPWFNSTVVDWMRRQGTEEREESAEP